MRIKATLENRIDLQVHTHGGTSNITSFDLVPDDTGIENYIQHWESLELIWVMATCTSIFYIFLILKLEYSIGDRRSQTKDEQRVCLLVGSVEELKCRLFKNMRSL